jgi:uncharacterized protein
MITRLSILLVCIAATALAISQANDGMNAGMRMSVHEELTAAGPTGPLAGTLTLPSGEVPLSMDLPVFLIVPGSGPTDRDGNSPLGITAAPYRLLAEELAAKGYASVRIDKRGMFGSIGAAQDPNNVTIAAYGDDLRAWIEAIQERLPANSGARCVIPIGHSEGGLVALAAMTCLTDACGLILIASIGRPLDAVLLEQLRANAANAPFLMEAELALAELKRGRRVDPSALSSELQPLFRLEVQGYLIDAISYDPLKLAAQVQVPILVLQGTRDLQVSLQDARMLAHAATDAKLSLLPDVNHVLKTVASEDVAANVATYADPDLPIAPDVVDVVAHFAATIAGK